MHKLKELVLEKLKENDARWFYHLYNGDLDEVYYEDEDEQDEHVKAVRQAFKDGSVKHAYYFNGGDGNDLIICVKIKFDKDDVMFVQIEGTYSSWDSNYFHEVYEAEPYKYTETRYKKKVS